MENLVELNLVELKKEELREIEGGILGILALFAGIVFGYNVMEKFA